VKTAFAWRMAGVPYDIIHGISNGVGAAVLFYPLNRLLNRIKTETINKHE